MIKSKKIIKCKACLDRKDDPKGCYKCGGSRIIAYQDQCPMCKRKGWFWYNSAMTVYDGYKISSLDGMVIVYHYNGSNCIKCEPTGQGVDCG